MFDVALSLSEKASDTEIRVIFWTGNVTMDTFYSYSTSQNTENHKQTKKNVMKNEPKMDSLPSFLCRAFCVVCMRTLLPPSGVPSHDKYIFPCVCCEWATLDVPSLPFLWAVVTPTLSCRTKSGGANSSWRRFASGRRTSATNRRRNSGGGKRREPSGRRRRRSSLTVFFLWFFFCFGLFHDGFMVASLENQHTALFIYIVLNFCFNPSV